MSGLWWGICPKCGTRRIAQNSCAWCEGALLSHIPDGPRDDEEAGGDGMSTIERLRELCERAAILEAENDMDVGRGSVVMLHTNLSQLLTVFNSVQHQIDTEGWCIVCGGTLDHTFADDDNPEGLTFRHRGECAMASLAAPDAQEPAQEAR